jgi:hypothetical protein
MVRSYATVRAVNSRSRIVKLMNSIRRFVATHVPDLLALGLLLTTIIALFVPMLVHMLWDRGFDYTLHAQIIQEIRQGKLVGIAHPLFHLMVAGVSAFLPVLPFLETLKQGSLIVATGIYVFTGVVFYGIIRSNFRHQSTWRVASISAVVSLLLMIVAPINLLSWNEGHLFWGYFLSNIHHNPTFVLLKPLAVLLFIYAAGAFSQAPYFQTRAASLISFVLVILATLAKPSFTIALLPALVIFGGFQTYRKQPVHWRLILFSIIVPAIIILGGQYLLQFLGMQNTWLDSGQVQFRPFLILSNRLVQFPAARFILSILFPLSILVLHYPQARRNAPLKLSWLIFGIAAVYSYCLVESKRIDDGNFIWSGHITVAVLFVVSMGFWLRQVRVIGFNRKSLIVATILALHGLSGLFWYYADTVSSGFTWY